MSKEKIVLLIDGGFLKVKLGNRLKKFPTAGDVVQFCRDTLAKPRLANLDLLRIYYYDAAPLSGTIKNPISGAPMNLGSSSIFTNNQSLISTLELEEDVAVRLGRLSHQGWEIRGRVVSDLMDGKRSGPVAAGDIQPSISQKGVDMKIGLDIAWIAVKGLAQHLVLVTGDSDFVPVMKFARKEGMRVYLESLGHSVHRDLKVHADVVL